MPEPKIYLNARVMEKRFADGGAVLNFSIRTEALIAFAKANENAGGYLNLCISPRREVGKYGETHSVYLDTYAPKAKRDDDHGMPF